jgi:hypothetical protein
VAINQGVGMSEKRLVWADDRFEFFDQLQAEWSSHGLADYQLVKLPLHRLLADDGEAIAWLRAVPPDILVLDWSEGKTEEVYRLVRTHIKEIILTSWNNRTSLDINGVFERWPALQERCLTKPFTTAELVSLIKKWHEKSRASTGLAQLLAIRYLDGDFVVIDTTPGWKLDWNRPVLEWTAEQRQTLLENQLVHHRLLSQSPTDPEKFGPMQFITQALPEQNDMGWPSGARYMQQGFELPETGLALETFGRSIDGIIKLMQQAGFARGRYYHLTDIPGLGDYALEMIARDPYDSGKLDLPAAHRLDDEERASYEAFCQQRRMGKPNKLIWQITPSGHHKSGANNEFWAQCIDMEGVAEVLRVPIFFTAEEVANRSKLRSGGGLCEFRGEFIFDKGKDQPLEAKHVKALKHSLLAAINYFAIARTEEREHFEQEIATQLLQFHQELSQKQNIKDIEMALTQKLLDLSYFFGHQLNLARQPATRSAMYVRHDMQRKHIRVSVEIPNLMEGFTFPLADATFKDMPIVKCANKAIGDSEEGRTCQPGIWHEPNFADRRAIFSQVAECTEASLALIMNRLENVKTLVIYPVSMGKRLLGVIAIRSSHLYAFDSKAVATSQRAIEVALPFLARLQEIESRRIWDGLVMHEMRSNLTWAKNKASRIADGSQEEERRAKIKEEVLLVLENGIEMSNMFLHWLGIADAKIEVRPTTDKFWKRLNHYGLFMQHSTVNRAWKCQADLPWMHDEEEQAHHSIFFERVIHILIDNAFRYGKMHTPVHCNIELDEKNQKIIVKITNHAKSNELAQELIDAQRRAVIDKDWTPGSKTEIGLTLGQMLCREVSADPISITAYDEAAGEMMIVATVSWPLERRK